MVTLHGVSAVDSIQASPSSVLLPLGASSPTTVNLTILAAGAPVVGVPDQCTVGDASKVTVSFPLEASQLRPPGGGILLQGIADGTTTVTCTLGGQSVTITATVQ